MPKLMCMNFRSVMNPEEKVEPHNHRFAGISSEAIFVKGGHIHEILTNVDFYESHLHELGVSIGLQIPVGIQTCSFCLWNNDL